MSFERAPARIGLAQVNARADLEANLEVAYRLVKQAASEGLELVAFPEMFLHLGAEREAKFNVAEPLDGRLVETFRQWAQQSRISILMGSHYEPVPDNPERLYNTSLIIDASGEVVAVYRKLHLFDIPALGVRESDLIAPGDEVVAVDHDVARIGLTICYDLRFPELYRLLTAQGAELILVPSAFFLETGKDHWLPLLRARAIENQVYLAAPAQWGWHYGRRSSFGQSVLIDPWGTVLASAPEQTGLISGTLDLERLRSIRERLPSWQHRRLELYPAS